MPANIGIPLFPASFVSHLNVKLKQNIYYLIYKILIIFELYKIFVLILILLNMQFAYK